MKNISITGCFWLLHECSTVNSPLIYVSVQGFKRYQIKLKDNANTVIQLFVFSTGITLQHKVFSVSIPSVFDLIIMTLKCQQPMMWLTCKLFQNWPPPASTFTASKNSKINKHDFSSNPHQHFRIFIWVGCLRCFKWSIQWCSHGN